jgi:DNA-binding MarR family transcriptional regulator
MTIPSDPALIAAVDALLIAAVGLTTRSLAASPASELTVGQWRMLSLLAQGRGGIRLTDLAEATGMSLPSASRMANRLVVRGFVRSVPDPDDRRAVRIGLTARGRATVEEVLGRRRAAVTEALAGRSLSGSLRDELPLLAASLAEAASGVSR